MDCAAEGRHRQPAGRFRIRQARGVDATPLPGGEGSLPPFKPNRSDRPEGRAPSRRHIAPAGRPAAGDSARAWMSRKRRSRPAARKKPAPPASSIASSTAAMAWRVTRCLPIITWLTVSADGALRSPHPASSVRETGRGQLGIHAAGELDHMVAAAASSCARPIAMSRALSATPR